MATHDYVIANGTGAAVRSDINGALAAIVSQNSSASEPSPTYAYMRWADTSAGVMKMRNGANSAWISLYQLDGEWTSIAFENGTAAAPSIYFKDSGTDTGIYSPGADQVGISTGGTVRLTTTTTGITSALPVDVPLGAVGTPSITFTGDLNTGIWSPSADTIAISTAGSNRVQVTSTGRALLNTTSPANVGGLLTQHVLAHSVSSQWGASIQHTVAAGSSPFGLAILYTAATPNSASSDFVWCEDATAIRARINSNGGLANYSANNSNLSDRSVKKDISLVANTWNCVKEWEIVNYRYKDQPDDADLNLGVIAQQVAESCPEVITIFQKAKDDQPEKLGVKEQQMYWMAIKALQEAMERIETLEASNADMLARLSALEAA